MRLLSFTGKYTLYREQLHFLEDRLKKEKSMDARNRLRKEVLFAQNAERQLNQGVKQDMKQRQELKERRSKAIAEVKQNREIANSYLKDTLKKMKDKAKVETDLSRSKYTYRMNTILELKNDIEHTRENLVAKRARDQANLKEKEASLIAERTSMEARGLNADAILLTNQRKKDFENERKQARAVQRQREVDILSKIIKEEENLERRKSKQPWVFQADVRGVDNSFASSIKESNISSVKPKMKRVLLHPNVLGDSTDTMDSHHPLQSADMGKYRDRPETATTSATSFSEQDQGGGVSAFIEDTSQIPEDEAEWYQIEDLNKPSFPGLWSGEVESGNKDREKYTLVYDTKMEKEMMFNALEKQRAGIVQKQVAARREFKGVAFDAKPEIVHFKDLEVGKTYKKKVKLTNVSYTINYLKLVGLSEHLKDFVTLDFESQGQMSAGMTCEILVTFSPMINENLEGTIDFLSQTGPVSLPVKCSVKKCDLSLDIYQVNFGTEVIGENLKRTFTLVNKGALPTEFLFQRKPLLKRHVATASSGHEYSSLASGMDKDGENIEITTTLVPDNPVLGEQQVNQEQESSPGGEKPDGSELNPQNDGDANQSNPSPREIAGTTMAYRSSYHDLMGQSVFESEEEMAKIDGMRTGPLRSGQIGPFQEVKLELMYDPLMPGDSMVEFEVSFTDPGSHPLYIVAHGKAIDVPVWVERETVPLHICMYDRLFQDSIVVNNRANIALGLKFEVDKRVKNHLELLPKTAYIQAQSTFSAQLKFLPRDKLAEEAGDLFDPETGILEVPCQIIVADQNEPVNFIVTAIVTPSDFVLNPKIINFGHCSIYENVVVPVTLTNKAILPQPFGFVKLPGYIEVQPNDGFGTLLPQESVEIHLIFRPTKAEVYEFEIACKSGIDRSFKLKCFGIAVHPPLELEHNTINFSATAVGDQNVTSVHLINSHTSRNEFTHPVPRIGKGEVAPVGPTSYEFCVPKGAPIDMWPSVGTIEPGSKELIKILFSPQLDPDEVKKEAVRIAEKRDREAALAEREEKYRELLAKRAEDSEKIKMKKKPSKSSAGIDSFGTEDNPSIESIPLREVAQFKPEDIQPNSDNYMAAKGSLLRSFEGSFNSHTILCYIASGKLRNPGELPYSVFNTLYLEVHCPAVRPKAIVISDSGSTTINFGQVAIGQSLIRPVTIQNITDDDIDAKATPLDPFGPFDLRNALLDVEANSTHTLLFNFTPADAIVYHETMKMTFDGNESLILTLTGTGVSPDVSLSITGNSLDCGHVLAGDSVPTVFTIKNNSEIAVPFLIEQDSNNPAMHKENQKLPYFIDSEKLEGLHVGPQNLYGDLVFDCTPWQGKIEPKSEQDITVQFTPDHPSLNFADVMRLSLFNLPFASIQLVGVGCVHTTYVEGGSKLAPAIESLGVTIGEADEDAAKTVPVATPILVEMKALRVNTSNEIIPAQESIYVGSVKTSASAQKKGGEFTFDNIQLLTAKGKLYTARLQVPMSEVNLNFINDTKTSKFDLMIVGF